jgi:hypothetical protein
VSLQSAKALATSDAVNAEWQQDLAEAHEKVGDAMSARGNTPRELTEYSEALAIAQRVAAKDPNDATLREGVAKLEAKMAKMAKATNPAHPPGRASRR